MENRFCAKAVIEIVIDLQRRISLVENTIWKIGFCAKAVIEIVIDLQCRISLVENTIWKHKVGAKNCDRK